MTTILRLVVCVLMWFYQKKYFLNRNIYLRKSYNVQTIYNFVDFCLGSWWIKFGISARPCRAVISNFIGTVIFEQADMKGKFYNSSENYLFLLCFTEGQLIFDQKHRCWKWSIPHQKFHGQPKNIAFGTFLLALMVVF